MGMRAASYIVRELLRWSSASFSLASRARHAMRDGGWMDGSTSLERSAHHGPARTTRDPCAEARRGAKLRTRADGHRICWCREHPRLLETTIHRRRLRHVLETDPEAFWKRRAGRRR